MVWTRDFRVSTITLDIDDQALTPIRGLVSANSVSGAEVESEQAAASVYADTATLKRIKPTIQFTTVDIPSAINAFGLLGKCITADADDEGLAFYGQKQGCMGGPAAGSVHDKYLIKNGLVVPSSLSVDHTGNAQLTFDVYTRYDGTSAPIVYSQNVALPTAPATPIGRWTMYELTLGSSSATALTGKRSININFGAAVTQEGADSEIYDSVVSLASLLPTVMVRGVDTSWLASIAPLLGASATYTYSLLSLKRRDAAVDQSQHVILHFQGLVTIEEIFRFTIGSPGESAIKINSVHDGTHAPIGWTTGTPLSS